MGHRRGRDRAWFSDLTHVVVQAFAEFLAIPTYIILGFLALGAGSYLLDSANPANSRPCSRSA